MDIQILDGKDGLQYVFDFLVSRYEQETMTEFQNLFKSVVTAIVNNANADGYDFEQFTNHEGCVRPKRPDAEDKRYLC